MIRRMRIDYAIAGAFLALTASLCGAGETRAADASKVMLVLDASGSMWGKVDGKAKIDIARSTIRSMLKDWDKDIELGLTAYGHRSKGDCNDIQVLLPVGPARPDAITSAVDALTPKGKTPLTAAVRQAAESMKFTENRATVILVSDGVETCEADPCKAAADLKKLGIDFTIHVVGFGLKKKEQAQLQCLAENTGGLFLSAGNASQLTSALKTTVVKVKEQAKIVAATLKPPKAVAPSGHQFTALLIDGGEPVAHGMRWEVYAADAAVDGRAKLIRGTYDAQPRLALPPGNYVMHAKYGQALATKLFTVESGQDGAKHVVVLNAGLVSAKAVYADGKEDVTSGLNWQIFAEEKGLDGKQKRLVGTYDTQPKFQLPAGRYQLVTKRDVAEVTQTIEVNAGKRSDIVVNLNAGLVVPSATLGAGSPALAKDLRWAVLSIDKDLSGKRKSYRNTYDAKPTFTLGAGKYWLEVANGYAEGGMEIEIGAAKRVEPVVVLNAGQIKLVAVKDGAPVSGSIRWDVYAAEQNLDGRRKHIGGASAANPIFTLPQGKFHLRMRAGAAQHEDELEVKAGDSKQVEVKLQ